MKPLPPLPIVQQYRAYRSYGHGRLMSALMGVVVRYPWGSVAALGLLGASCGFVLGWTLYGYFH